MQDRSFMFGQPPTPPPPSRRLVAAVAAAGVAAVIILLGAVFSYTGIESGTVGVVRAAGGRVVREIEPGVHFLPPWYSVVRVDVREQKAMFLNLPSDYRGDEKFYGRIDAGSVDTQNVYIDATVNWRVEAGKATSLVSTIGPDYFQRLVSSRVRDVTKSVVATYDAVEATRKRAEIAGKVVATVNASVQPYGITVVSMQLDNLSYSPEFERAIEEKQVATQQALKAQEQVAQREAEARGNVAKAKGDADSKIEAARGEAEAIRVKAVAQADANRRLNESLTPSVIQAQAIERWNGAMPAFLPSNGSTIVNPAGLLPSGR